MRFNFKEIERVEKISKQDFLKNYYKPQIPVVVEKLTEDWAAYSQWNFNYLKKIAGEIIVPLYDNEPVKAKDGFNQPKASMPLNEYLDLLEKQPTDLRIFLFNLIKNVPGLQKDFDYPDLGLKLMKALPMLFFGGYNSSVFMHYDIDLANIFHFHFQGEKTCILVPPSQTRYMYKVPFSVITREDIDFNQPDFNKFPLLQKLQPYKTSLKHGEMLYMPEGYWHHMTYNTPGFSMSLRSIAKKTQYLAEALYNVLIMRHFDNGCRKIFGQKWIDFKNEKALR